MATLDYLLHILGPDTEVKNIIAKWHYQDGPAKQPIPWSTIYRVCESLADKKFIEWVVERQGKN
jgi:hypothetical protein